MDSRVSRFCTPMMLAGVLAAGLVGCDRHQILIPDGAQVVRMVVTASEVRLDPATVRAGDVYLVVDGHLESSFTFVERQRSADETPGPLSDDDLERLAHGDSEGTSMSGFHAGGCSPEQIAQDRDKTGYCGYVSMVTVRAGQYAILGPGWTLQETEASVDPTADPAGFAPPASMAVLVVVP